MSRLTGDLQDAVFEADLLRDPYSLKSWTAYLEYQAERPQEVRNLIYERALHKLPASYKLWFHYLNERKEKIKGLRIDNAEYEKVNICYERALVHLHKMPRIWKDYAEFLWLQKKITRTRQTYDRALQALPITQHLRWVWPGYIQFAKECGVPETGIRIWRRYLRIHSNEVEDFISYLKKVGRVEDAAQQLAKIVNDESFVSSRGKSKHDLWSALLKLVVKNPSKVPHLNVDAIIRSGMRRFPSEVGRLWNALADYYIRLGHFETARDVYEQGINSVATVHDFSLIFDAYAQFEDSMITARMDMMDAEMKQKESAGAAAAAGGDEDDADASASNSASAAAAAGKGRAERRKAEREQAAKAKTAAARDPETASLMEQIEAELADQDRQADEADDVDIDLRMLRLESLHNRAPELRSSVLLRQNPHNVKEWHERVKLFKDDPLRVIQTYTDAVATVEPQKATGRPHTLWVAFAKFYEENDSLDDARIIFEKATQVNYKTPDDLAAVWCEWAEMELRHDKFAEALAVMKRAVTPPRGKSKSQLARTSKGSVQELLFKNTKVWQFYVDLEENLGTVDSAKAAYEQMISLKAATPKIIINYATFLEEHKFFEESFRAYEKGIAQFEYPHVLPIWLSYLKKFIERYGGKKVERTRDLFEQATEKVPAKDAKNIYLLYAKFEEDHGLARRAMQVYERACSSVEQKDRAEMYQIWIARCAEFFGVTKTREIFEKALKSLPDDHVKRMCIQFADLERKLGEIDRARKIYEFGSQFADPRTEHEYWNTWRDFEVKHGNEDTFREMLRIKRSVQAQFSTINTVNASLLNRPNVVSGGVMGGDVKVTGKRKEPPSNTLEVLEMQADAAKEEAKARAAAERKAAAAAPSGLDLMSGAAADLNKSKMAAAANPEEIQIGGDEDTTMSDRQQEILDEAQLTTAAIPEAVFGDAVKAARAEKALEEQENMGALARFKKRRVE